MGNIHDIEPDELRNLPSFRAAYSDRTALLMAKLSKRVYDPFNDDASFQAFQAVFTSLGLKVSTKFIDKDSGTAGAVLEGSDIIVIVFRGTNNILDWLINLRMGWHKLQGGIKVHVGFYCAYSPIKSALFEKACILLKERRRPVYITGHSLGRALAVMATAELGNHDEADVRDSFAACYTFGCPKTGDCTFDQYVKVPIYRVANGIDIVPTLPPIFSGYAHVGDTRYFGRIGVSPLRRAPSVLRKLRYTSLRLMMYFVFFRRFQNVADHEMEIYISKLDAWTRASANAAHQRRQDTADPSL